MRRDAPRRLLDALASRPLSAGLLAALVLYGGFLLAWSLLSPPMVVQAIARGWPYRAEYLLLGVNTVACIAVFWRPALARCRPYLLEEDAAAWPARAFALPGAGEAAVGRVARALRRRGYRVRRRGDGAVFAGRGRWSALGTPIFHLALVALALALAAHARTAFSATAVLTEGQSFFGEPRDYGALSPEDAARAPRLSFKVLEVRPEFYGSHLFFTGLSARVEGPVGPEARVQEVRLSSAAALGEGLVSLAGFGYSLEYELRSGGALVDGAVVSTMIFPPGQRDSFALAGRPYTVFVELFPDFALEAGKPASRSMRLENPRLGVTVLRGRAVLARKLVRPGQPVEFDGLALSFPRIVPQGQFRIRSSPAAPWVGLALLAALAGLLLRVGWRRREVLLRPGTAGLEVSLEGEGLEALEASIRRWSGGGEGT